MFNLSRWIEIKMKKIMIRITKFVMSIYRKGDQKLVVSYDYEDYVKLNKIQSKHMNSKQKMDKIFILIIKM